MNTAEREFVDLSDPQVVCNAMELTAAELERRAERLLKYSRDLLAQASLHATLAGLPDERSLARNGQVVTEVEAIRAAKELGTFSRAQFAEALGLQPASVSRWLAKLIEREHPIITRTSDGYSYIDPAPVAELLPKSDRTRKAKGFQTAGGQEGTGGTMRGVAKELRPIVRQAMSEGWALTQSGSGHYQLIRGEQIVGFAKTPRNPGNAANDLRQKLRNGPRSRRVLA